jgi:hypothetical protein
MRRARVAALALVVLAAGSAACSAILGLDAPPEQDGGASTDATTSTDAALDGDDGGAVGDGAIPDTSTTPPVCMPLDGGPGDGGSYASVSDPASWELYDTHALSGFAGTGYIGGTFDGRYIYFAGRAARVARYDTLGGGFSNPLAWAQFEVGSIGAPGGFAGAAFDGRYVYFVPFQSGTTYESVLVRYDNQGSFASATSWASFDLSTLAADGGAATSGFFGAVFDGHYLYFVPRNDGAPDGRLVRYDPSGLLDAGPPSDGGDGGDGGGSGELGDPSRWATFDVSSTNPLATGYAGGVHANGALYLAPNFNGAFDAQVHGGGSGIAARFATAGGFTTPGSWTTFDTTSVNGYAEDNWGGAFDGRYVYFVPHGEAVVSRVDTSTSFGSISSWSAYDTTRITVADGGGVPSYAGGAFDGRFVYVVPSSTSTLIRYDTASTFSADCAWSKFDLDALSPPDGGPFEYNSAVFDGQYLYLVPALDGLFARFAATSSSPVAPLSNGSFL